MIGQAGPEESNADSELRLFDLLLNVIFLKILYMYVDVDNYMQYKKFLGHFNANIITNLP